MESDQLASAAQVFPFFRELSDDGAALLARTSTLVHIPAGRAIWRPGDECEQIAFVLEGEVRAHKTSEAGRDLTLYRIYPGQTCILTALSILAGQPFPARVDVSVQASALLVPRRSFRWLFDTQEPWRQFVFRTVSERLADLLSLIDSVLFTDLPSRLADTLITAQEAGVVRATHEQLAGEVGSSREVVSRVLKSWERQGVVALSRGQVAIASSESLMRLLAR